MIAPDSEAIPVLLVLLVAVVFGVTAFIRICVSALEADLERMERDARERREERWHYDVKHVLKSGKVVPFQYPGSKNTNGDSAA